MAIAVAGSIEFNAIGAEEVIPVLSKLPDSAGLLLRLPLTVAASLALPHAAFANEAADPITVTGTRTLIDTGDSGGSTIKREDIEVAQPVTLLDLLDGQPGIRAFDKRGPGGGPYLSVRGGEPNHTVVAIEGAIVNDPTSSQGGAFDFALLAPFAVERIDILRSGVGSLAGPNTLSGAVDVALRDVAQSTPLLAAQLTADSQEYVSLDNLIGTQLGDGDVIVGGGWSDSGKLVQASKSERWHAIGKVRQNFAGAQLRLAALHSEADKSAYPEDSGGPRLAANDELEQRELKFDLVTATLATRDAETRSLRANANWQRQEVFADTPAIFPGKFDGVPAIESDTAFTRFNASISGRVRASDLLEISVGAAYTHEKGDSEGSVDFGFAIPASFEIRRSLTSLFGEIGITPSSQLSLSAGLRRDDPSAGDANWTYRFAGRAELGSGIAAFASYATSEKLPSLFALAYPLIANPELLPERSRTFDAGLDAKWERGFTRIAYFNNRYRDLIDFEPELFTNVNRGRVSAKGVEAELQIQPTKAISAGLNATYLDTTNFDGPPLRSRPEWQFAGYAGWQISERLSGHASLAHVGSQLDSSIATGPVILDAYWQGDVSLAWQATEATALRLGFTNIFDDYEDAIGFPAPRRAVRLTLQASI